MTLEKLQFCPNLRRVTRLRKLKSAENTNISYAAFIPLALDPFPLTLPPDLPFHIPGIPSLPYLTSSRALISPLVPCSVLPPFPSCTNLPYFPSEASLELLNHSFMFISPSNYLTSCVISLISRFPLIFFHHANTVFPNLPHLFPLNAKFHHPTPNRYLPPSMSSPLFPFFFYLI